MNEPSFPPLLTGHAVDADDDPFERACAGAGAAEFGAGDLVWSRALDRIAMALVMEPDVDRQRSREMIFVAMVACADAVGANIPPEIGFTWLWPTTLRANGARVGQVRYAEAESEAEDGAPEWIVVGIEIILFDAKPRDVEPGQTPERTTLFDEGTGEIEAHELISSIARHWTTWIHRWDGDGFAPVHENWLFRADGHKETVSLETREGEVTGVFLGIDEAGNLLLKEEAGSTRALSLAGELGLADGGQEA
ncbi:hypothetical protein HPQ64_11755 [Rhizobiales bacterium]|uniref:biotin/lipoate--protein ligase family protein n=1 Tax=Hongsoonwoonella zoysiae TaxID=2821844 RepID=UPI001560BC5A|nr:biotin/lipoate--protein ligase family protein [Hongsoonwoonella zoysiae]NRG18365.1 hypothetical protein [Hongsoonwoonella zoysiae]